MTDRAPAWRAWVRRRWPALTIGVCSLPVVVMTLVGTLHWPGRIFPGFFLMQNALVPTVGTYEWTGMQAGVPFLARVTSVDGMPVDDHATVYAIVESKPVGTPIRYALAQGGRTMTAVVPTMRFTARDYWLTVGIFALFGVVALGLGVLVGLLQPDTQAARAFLLQGSVTGLYALAGTALYHPHLSWLSPLYALVQSLLAATFIHLWLVFPVPRRFIMRDRRWLAVPYGVAVIVFLWFLAGFYASPPDTTPIYVSFLYTGIGLVTFMAVPVFSWWENRLPRVRQQLRVVIPGAVVPAGVALFAHLQAARAEFPLNLMALVAPFFYASIAWAILRHDLFDIDTLVKQAVIFATLTLGITGAYAGSVALATRIAPDLVEAAGRWLQVGFVVLIAMAFEPARRRTQQAVDALFFRRRLDYRGTVSELSAALTSLLDLEEILTRVGRTVMHGFQNSGFAVVLWQDDVTRLHVYDPQRRALHTLPGPALTALRAALDARAQRTPPALPSPDDTSLPREDMASLPGGTPSLLVPLMLGGRVLGAFALGPRRSGRTFGREDIELLATLAAQSAIAIGNARSYRALQDLNLELEQKVQSRTADLEASLDQLKRAQHQLVQAEKMASLGVLVAGVAHEINNPVTFIVNNIEPVKESVAALRESAAAHPELGTGRALEDLEEAVDLIAKGADRTAGIVSDLRSFSRLGDGAAAAVDVHDAIEVSLRLLRPRWSDRITIHRDYQSLPSIQASPGQLNQVFMNLLSNACDAIPERGNIWIGTDAGERTIRVRIRDNGSGIAREHLSRIFDPFFTTKPQGQGTGLGLSITHGIVTGHGGGLEVTSEPGIGTTITVSLPIASDGARQATIA